MAVNVNIGDVVTMIMLLVKQINSLDEAVRRANDLPPPEPLPTEFAVRLREASAGDLKPIKRKS